MIIEVPSLTGNRAWQVIAHIQKVDRSMPKSVLEGMLRELIEHHLHMDLTPAQLDRQISQTLAARGVHLKRVELRKLDIGAVLSREGLQPQWWEVLVEDLSTADGFGVSLDVVVRAHLAPAVAQHQGNLLVLRSTLTAGLQVELADLFQSLELENLLSDRNAWTSKLLHRLTEGNFDKVLDQTHSAKIGPGHNAGLETIWITELKVKARESAFRPQPRQRYYDPLGHFLSYGELLRKRQLGQQEL